MMRRWERWAGAAALVLAAACGDTTGNGTPMVDVPLSDVEDTSTGDTVTGEIEEDVEEDVGEDATPDVVPDEGTPDTGPDTEADVEPDVEPDVELDTATDVELDTVEPDAELDVEADVELDTVEPDAVMDVEGDVDLDTATDVDLDTATDVDLDTTTDVADAGPDAEEDTFVPPTGDGETCATAIVIDPDALPWSFAGTTVGMADDYMSEGCGGSDLDDGSFYEDVVFAFTPTVAGTYTFELIAPNGDSPTILYAATDCGDIANTCVGWSDDMYLGGEWDVPLEAGTTYYFVLDGYMFSDYGDYELIVNAPCIPSCDGKACGDDGCGGTCGACDEGDLCGETFQCEDADLVVGNNCANPLFIDGDNLPFSGTGSTTTGNATNDYTKPSDACGLSSTFGASANDQVWTFTPPTTGLYTLELTLDGFWDSAFYVVTDCTDVANSCVKGADGTKIEAVLEGGLTYYIIVDGYSSATGSYTLDVSAPCAPQCDGRECGSDGCQGVCGTCEFGDICDDGVCTAAAEGDTCGSAFFVDSDNLPFSATGSTTTGNATNGYTKPSGACGLSSTFGASANDQVWMFIPPSTGLYTLEMTLDGFWDSAFYVTTDCADIANACVKGADGTTIEAVLEGGMTYYIIVDGYSSATGSYTLDVSAPCAPQCDGLECGDDGCQGVCGTCEGGDVCVAGMCTAAPEGDTCDDPIFVDALPFVAEGSTADFSSDYGYGEDECPGETSAWGAGSNDAVYALTADVDGTYTVTLDASFDSNLYAVTDCGDIANTCLAAHEKFGSGETIELALSAGQTVFIIVDGYGNTSNQSGSYTLTIDPPCVPSCDGVECGGDGCGGSCGTCTDGGVCVDGICEAAPQGDTCADPYVVDTIPFLAEHTTADFSSDYGYGADDCPGVSDAWGSGSNDTVYALTAAVDGTYTVTLDASFDSNLYAVTDCSDIANTCLAADEIFGTGETISLALTAGQTVFIIVDGWGNSSNQSGSYSLSVTLD